MTINSFCFILLLNFGCCSAFCFSVPDSILYQQELRRDDVGFVQALRGTKGVLLLTVDSVKFQPIKSGANQIGFSLPYSQIKKIKRYKAALIPNRIGIRTFDRGTYRLFTYRRNKILEILESRLSSR